jgi:predicted RNA-binding protein YlxR (DUF448 family)
MARKPEIPTSKQNEKISGSDAYASEPEALHEKDENRAPAPSGPQRSCIVTREIMPEHQLIRFVYGPDNSVVPDLRHKLPGRGAYVSTSKAVVQKAIDKNLFSRAFKRPVKASPDLCLQLESLMYEDIVAALALANKAGQVIAGFDTIEGEATRKSYKLFLHASDASPQGYEKLKRICGQRKNGSIYRLLNTQSLSGALGRDNTVHVAVRNTEVGRALDGRLARLAAFLDVQTP